MSEIKNLKKKRNRLSNEVDILNQKIKWLELGYEVVNDEIKEGCLVIYSDEYKDKFNDSSVDIRTVKEIDGYNRSGNIVVLSDGCRINTYWLEHVKIKRENFKCNKC